MKKFSIVMLLLLTSCTSLQKNSDDLNKSGHDVFDEEVDEINED